MKYTLLEVVQHVLSSMDSDEVDSISDSTEAEQVALVCEEVFYDIIEQDEWPNKQNVINLDSVSDTDNPTSLLIPDEVAYVWNIKYNVKKPDDDNKIYRTLEYKRPEDFVELVLRRNTSDSNVKIVEPNEQAEIFIITDQMPNYWTSFDDKYIILDSYDSDVDTTVQSSKTIAFGEIIPTFQMQDDWTIDFPAHMHPYYLAECKAYCHWYFKQQQSVKDERKALRSRSRLRRIKNRTGVDYYDQTARKNFGRKHNGPPKHPTLGRR